MKKTVEAIGKFLISLLFLGGGLLFAYCDYYVSAVEISGDNWIAASTTINYTYGVRVWGGGASGRSGVEYVLWPTYTFAATDSKTYSGNQYYLFGDGKINRKIGSEEELKSHLVENGTIYYNPQNPNQSAVQRPYFNPAIPIMFGILILFIIYLAISLVIHEEKLLITEIEAEIKTK